MRFSTLCFLLRGEGSSREILLAMKKRGFGVGKWNGIGGKVDEGEGVEAAALRELTEEIGVTAEKKNLAAVGLLQFRSTEPSLNWDVQVFFLRTWTGDPVETEEMRPEWYPVDSLPFDFMWPDDRHWLPRVLAGETIEAKFDFDPDGKTIKMFEIKNR